MRVPRARYESGKTMMRVMRIIFVVFVFENVYFWKNENAGRNGCEGGVVEV